MSSNTLKSLLTKIKNLKEDQEEIDRLYNETEKKSKSARIKEKAKEKAVVQFNEKQKEVEELIKKILELMKTNKITKELFVKLVKQILGSEIVKELESLSQGQTEEDVQKETTQATTDQPKRKIPKFIGTNPRDRALHELYFVKKNYIGRDRLWRLAKQEYPDLQIGRDYVWGWLKRQELAQVTQGTKKPKEDKDKIYSERFTDAGLLKIDPNIETEIKDRTERFRIRRIEKPLMRRVDKKYTPSFEVSWIGFRSTKDNTIEPRSNLLNDAPKLVHTYEREHDVVWKNSYVTFKK